jgi:hypothetical protein
MQQNWPVGITRLTSRSAMTGPARPGKTLLRPSIAIFRSAPWLPAASSGLDLASAAAMVNAHAPAAPVRRAHIRRQICTFRTGTAAHATTPAGRTAGLYHDETRDVVAVAIDLAGDPQHPPIIPDKQGLDPARPGPDRDGTGRQDPATARHDSTTMPGARTRPTFLPRQA